MHYLKSRIGWRNASFATLIAALFLANAGCGTAPAVHAIDAGVDVGVAPVDATSDSNASSMGFDFFARIVGLWSGPATDTRLGNFPLTNMDFRAVSDGVLFARVDLDAQNSLRFAFQIEERNGVQKLIFRNGGLFQGLARDTRMELLSAATGVYRFCAVDMGCSYADATFSFASATSFEMRVLVRQQLHEVWTAQRVETRTLPDGFPLARNVSPSADFSEMGSAQVRITWTAPLAVQADVWAILSTTSCVPTGSCAFSRWIKTVAAAGATSTSIAIDQIHQGNYRLLAVVDRNNSLATTRFPDSGDTVSIPDSTIAIPANGQATTSVAATYSIP